MSIMKVLKMSTKRNAGVDNSTFIKFIGRNAASWNGVDIHKLLNFIYV